CMRTFAPKFIQGVIDLYRGLLTKNRALVVDAYETWGFAGLSNALIDILNIWANFIYGPMLEDRIRTIADDQSPGMYGRREAFKVHQGLRDKGPVKVPREFVFMDRAAIGLGGVFLHLNAELNFHRLFDDTIIDVDLGEVARRQIQAFAEAKVPLHEGIAWGPGNPHPADCPPHRLYAIAIDNRGIRASGEWNAYRPSRVPSVDGLQ